MRNDDMNPDAKQNDDANRTETNRTDPTTQARREGTQRMNDDRNDRKRMNAGRGGGRDDGRRDEGRLEDRGDEGRHDGGRYDTGRFEGRFYEGGRPEGGMSGRYGAGTADYDEDRGGYERGGYDRGYERGGYGGGGYEGGGPRGGAYAAGGYPGSGYVGGYGGGFQGGYGSGYGSGFSGYDRFGGGSSGSAYDIDQDRYDRYDRDDSGGGMTWKIAAGAALAAVGGYALYRSTMGTQHDRQGRSRWRGIHVEESVTIDRPASEIYKHWRNLENLGDILSHVEKVETLHGDRSRWTAKGPANTKVEWDAEMVQDRENERITWRSVPGADVPNEGSVWFEERSGGRGTEVHVSLMYHPPGGALAAGLASLFGREPHQQVAADLRRFKARMEAGESLGKSHASPSARTSGNT